MISNNNQDLNYLQDKASFQNYYQSNNKVALFQSKLGRLNQSPQKTNHIENNNNNINININNNSNNKNTNITNNASSSNNKYFQHQDEFNLNVDIKCLKHNQLDLTSVCEDCLSGVCPICIDENHAGHKISEINKMNGQYIVESFKANQLPNIMAYRESDKVVSNAVDHCFGLVESRHQENLIKIHQKFKQLHQVLLDLESNVSMILESNHADNEELYTKIKNQLQQDSDLIDAVISRHNHCLENYDIFDMYDQQKEKQLLSIIKDTEICNQLVEKKKSNRFQPFSDNTIHFDQDLEDVFTESIGNFYNIESKEFKDKDNQYLLINKLAKCGNFNYYVTHGEPIPSDISSLGLSNKIKFNELRIPETIKEIHFLNGFNHQFESHVLPKGIQKLFFYDIAQPLKTNSIPSTVKEVHFCSGFSHTIAPNVIPSTVSKVVLYDIKQPLQPGSIANGVTELHLNNGFNQFILPNIIPDSIEKLYLYEIKQPLLSGCIPSTLRELYLRSGFNHPITPSIIPHSLKLLYIGDVKQQLNQGSIPFGIKEIHFGNGFDQPITSDIIPSSVESLFFYNIKYPLSPYSIPNTVKELQLGNGFSHIIHPKTIPSNVSRLIIYSFKPPITKGSVPSTVKEMYLFKGVNNQIQPGIIPDSIKILNI
ncbi:FNIP repeat-containing protein [Dictyostelium discoideum AX4]|uniref:FNIP repeat-containing protein n=1 Tax=Dictyostelium discoideum TaxID=44689 RepID=Q54M62_DICDI|nr:FNIP repeat-containing protein [Dictyostelium discoideum AX4]EAL64374.1 FNIP repeat-containing protein [Dictyostelium discoideum AX4]|eukprot:XP_637886.1 FNIP repeat-containing protein [Dictyostelium discoideum AX4]